MAANAEYMRWVESRSNHRHRCKVNTAPCSETQSGEPQSEAGGEKREGNIRKILEDHVAACGIPEPPSIVIKNWTKAGPSKQKKRAAEARLADSFEDLMTPILEKVSVAKGNVTNDIVGVSQANFM